MLKNLKKVLILFTISYLIIITNVFIYDTHASENEVVQTYTGDNGVTIISYSKNWSTKDKLEEIYEELISNFHSEEMNYLKKIYIYPNSKEGVAGYYYNKYSINSRGRYKMENNRYIEIFNGDKYTRIEEIARTLSHEYGHHFTTYYVLTKENRSMKDWGDEVYLKVRGIENYYKQIDDISEIAAEDYVQLFGSELTKKSVDYKDVKERIEGGIKKYYYSSNSYNLVPQQNLEIPLAANIDGLANYWIGLVGKPCYEPNPPNKVNLKIVESKEIYINKYQYKFEWEPVEESNERYEYTLVLYNNVLDFPQPIKTVYTGEKMEAYTGYGYRKMENNKIRVIEDNYKGEYKLKLFIKDERNFIYCKDELKVKFDKSGRYKIIED